MNDDDDDALNNFFELYLKLNLKFPNELVLCSIYSIYLFQTSLLQSAVSQSVCLSHSQSTEQLVFFCCNYVLYFVFFLYFL